MRELCRLQTFPDNVVISGGRSSIQRQVGNAVPSLLAEVLGRSIKNQLLDLSLGAAPLQLLPPARPAPPGPEPVYPVPEKFLEYVGEHPPHPGTGQGYAAKPDFGTRQHRGRRSATAREDLIAAN